MNNGFIGFAGSAPQQLAHTQQPPVGGAADLGGGRMLTTPWLDYASTALPENHRLVLYWSQLLWFSDGNYRTAMERVASHFLTELSFNDVSSEEEDTWRDVLKKHLRYRDSLLAMAYDLLCYGNSFTYLYIPFRRFLICNQCGLDVPIEKADYQLSMSSTPPYLSWRRTSPCPRCGSLHPFKLKDRRDSDISEIRMIQVPPDEVEIAYNPFSTAKKMFWILSPEDRNLLKTCQRIYVDTTPEIFLEAAARNGNVEMDNELFLHSMERTVSGLKSKGWGTPRMISNFRSAWLQQLNNKQEQAVSIDYTLGLRLLSPHPTPGGDDPMINHGQELFASRMGQIIQKHRNNPVGFHTSPYPVNYQFLGGEGASLMSFEKLKFRHQEFLNQMGVPLEYHQMNLSSQAAPMALKLFENYWQLIPSAYNNVLSWVVANVSRVFGLKPTSVEMSETTLAYDMERKHMLLQLMAGQQVSAETALRPWGINARDEVRNVMRYGREVDRLHREEEEHNQKQEELGALRGLTQQPTPGMMLEQQMAEAEAAQGGGMPGGGGMGGGMPIGGAPGGVSDNSSLAAMSEQAMEIAHQLLQMPEGDRRRQLKDLRETNKDLHSLVIANLQKLRSQARSEGGQMMIEQGMLPPPPA